MREVEIDKQGGINKMCPMCFNSYPLVGTLCGDKCAWFRILDLAEVEGENKDGPHAYCQEHCIGRIKSG